MHNCFCLLFSIVFLGEFAGAGHAVLFKVFLVGHYFKLVASSSIDPGLSETGFIAYDCFQAYS